VQQNQYFIKSWIEKVILPDEGNESDQDEQSIYDATPQLSWTRSEDGTTWSSLQFSVDSLSLDPDSLVYNEGPSIAQSERAQSVVSHSSEMSPKTVDDRDQTGFKIC